MSPPIHIVLTFDDAFWAPAATAIRSICATSHRRTDIIFHLCHSGLVPDHHADIEAAAATYGAAVRHYQLDGFDFLAPFRDQLPRSRTSRWNDIVYARLFLKEILPPGIEKILFIDADIYCRRPIETLYEQDLMGHPMAACEAVYHVEAQLGPGFSAKLGLFDPAAPYFNAGVMLIDLRQWSGAEIVARFRALLGARADDPTALARMLLDQDVLNLVFRGRWLKLDFRWNFQDPLRPHERLFPYIVHYSGHQKPWRAFSRAAFARHYRQAMTKPLYRRYRRFLRKRAAARLMASLIGRKV